MLKVTKTAAGEIKLIYEGRTYVIPQKVYSLLVQLISTDLLKDAKHQ
jgi:hypothetical protein